MRLRYVRYLYILVLFDGITSKLKCLEVLNF